MFVSKMKTVVGVLILCAMIGTGAGAFAVQQAPQPEGPKQPAPANGQEKKLSELMKARLEAAEKETETRRLEFLAGRGMQSLLLEASKGRLRAQRELSENKGEVVAALEAHYLVALEVYVTSLERFNAGRIAITDLKQAEFYKLDAEIALELAKAK